MTVTPDETTEPAQLALDEITVASIDLAVAQWMRSPRATSLARERLRTLGVAEDEIEERRRCRSGDRELRAVLRLAVTIVITRGRLEERDRALLAPAERSAMLGAVAHATALALLRVTLSNAATSAERYPAIDVDIEDY